MRWPFFTADHFTEILIIGDQNPIFRVRFGKDIVIRHPTSFFEYGKNFVRLIA